MASRNGLNPKLRGSKGRGFNRALPAPFGWGNGIKVQGKGWLEIPRFVNKPMSNEWSFEYWVDATSLYGTLKCILSINEFSKNKSFFIDDYGGSVQFSSNLYTGGNSVPINPRVHVVVTFKYDSKPTSGLSQIFLNGKLSTTGYLDISYPFNVERATLFAKATTSTTQAQKWLCPVDEIRFYNKVLMDNEISINYNGGIGGNPCVTENIFAWFEFERFELLDFSELQDGSDMRIGIKDISGNYNHAESYMFVTDPTSPDFVLTAF